MDLDGSDICVFPDCNSKYAVQVCEDREGISEILFNKTFDKHSVCDNHRITENRAAATEWERSHECTITTMASKLLPRARPLT